MLLELNTAVHVILALIMYSMWWHKPRDIEAPITINYHGLCDDFADTEIATSDSSFQEKFGKADGHLKNGILTRYCPIHTLVPDGTALERPRPVPNLSTKLPIRLSCNLTWCSQRFYRQPLYSAVRVKHLRRRVGHFRELQRFFVNNSRIKLKKMSGVGSW